MHGARRLFKDSVPLARSVAQASHPNLKRDYERLIPLGRYRSSSQVRSSSSGKAAAKVPVLESWACQRTWPDGSWLYG